jgi:hypothetical protein
MPVASEATAPAPVQRAKPTEYVAYPESMKKVKPTEIVCYPAQQAQAAEAAPAVVAPAATPIVAPAAATVIAPVDLSSSGLILIETDPNKAASVAPVQESGQRAPRRRQRPREVYSIEDSEPLQQVETHTPN